jgi:hypothetical protein
VGDPGLGVDPELATAIDPLGCGREHLADPIGHQGEERLTGDGRHSLPPPASQVRHNDVLAEMQLRLVEDPPPAGPVDTPVEGISENHADLRSHRRVRLPRPGAQEQFPIEDLGHLVLGGVQHVLVRRALHRIGLRGTRLSRVYALARTARNADLARHSSPPNGTERRTAKGQRRSGTTQIRSARRVRLARLDTRWTARPKTRQAAGLDPSSHDAELPADQDLARRGAEGALGTPLANSRTRNGGAAALPHRNAPEFLLEMNDSAASCIGGAKQLMGRSCPERERRSHA